MRGRFLVVLCAFLASCDAGPVAEFRMPDVADAGLPAPDPNFRLEPSAKRRLAVAFDTVATEKFLAWYRPGFRDEVLQTFLELADQASRGEITITNIGFDFDPADARNPEITALARAIFKAPFNQFLQLDSEG